MGRFSNLVSSDDFDDIQARWDAEGDGYTPIPNEVYLADVISWEPTKSRNGTLGCRLQFQIKEGDYAGRHLWQNYWMSPKAMPRSKRQLRKLNISSPKQLRQPVPQGLVCKIEVIVTTRDDGSSQNEVLDIIESKQEHPTPDPYAPNQGDVDTEPNDNF